MEEEEPGPTSSSLLVSLSRCRLVMANEVFKNTTFSSLSLTVLMDVRIC